MIEKKEHREVKEPRLFSVMKAGEVKLVRERKVIKCYIREKAGYKLR